MSHKMLGALAASLISAFAQSATAATLVPAATVDIGLTVQVTELGNFTTKALSNNYAAPQAIGDYLYLINQRGAAISIWDGTSQQTALAALPDGVTPAGRNGILNMAGTAGTAYVRYTSSTLPTGFSSVAALPDDPAYDTRVLYELVYAYDQAADGTLSNPRPLSAFETSSITGVHRGDGMLVLPDGRLLIARGDNLNGDYYGLEASQDAAETVSKLLVIDPADGSVTVVAEGLRNVQTLTWKDSTQTEIAFSDIGWRVAEEINVISLADLLDTSEIENFGWGIGADGLGREGTFYVGHDGLGTKEQNATALGEAPLGEAGYVQPYAQFGRDDPYFYNYFAVTGPVASDSFSTIGLLFGDLADGNLFATLKDVTGDLLNDVYDVLVLNDAGERVSLGEYLGGSRIDLRFFNFADGSVGFISEVNGTIYALSELALPEVPLPAGGLLLLGALGLFGTVRRRKR